MGLAENTHLKSIGKFSVVLSEGTYKVKNRNLKMFYGGTLPQDVNATRASITELLSLSGNRFVCI